MGVPDETQLYALTERATAESTTRFSASEADVLDECELRNDCALR